ncbi:hypothetical protein PTSG_08981 [Salpingoeca rosetta]|uniref:Secreted protein n=1 Tax=Salpingoeca rosetta (strain ATCC 50818 / BSB-021) TaxID=946362 RepID=F2ULV4_SALR5|nr:uncharacterized protein PTSG_08981 [Salpingoeca rosetta]EGD78103.1 hypothetical protein PTSG_08981 [Salpingoeca rosetta]|eukprot:XP_004989779.1 hypothetical protein PTSG_08981 [Salpingoeca rosetta]
MLRFLAVALAFAAVAVSALPVEEQTEGGVTTPIPTGNFVGNVAIVPYTRKSGGYACTTCSPVTAPARFLFFNNAMMLNISYASSGSCSLNTQGYYFYSLAPHSGGAYPYYYVGQVQVENAVIPVCFYFDYTVGNFRIVLDGQGTCPTASQAPACQNGWTPGTVTQSWSGSFTSSSLPSGDFFGNIAIVPYTKKSGGKYTCTTCAPVTSKATATWNGDQFSLYIRGDKRQR